MIQAEPLAADEHRKEAEALRRAVPITRMVDYGVPLGDALAVHARTMADEPSPWDEACESLALRHRGLAEQAEERGCDLTAAQAWRAAAALLQCAQLRFNADQPRKQALYEAAHEALRRHARLGSGLEEVRIETAAGELYGWRMRPAGEPARAAVIVLGGLSGWGAAYLDMGRALARRGILAILGEGPGQGLTRMRSGLHLRPDTLPLLQAFVDAAVAEGARQVGVWGNSFGGLFAAQLAATDARVRAVCINGAPSTPHVPSFRTAREQMCAVFGVDSEAGLAERLASLAMTPEQHRIAGAMLVVEGGRDALVQPGEQAPFLWLAQPSRRRTMTWDDGEHTIYNHAAERNARVADWFARELADASHGA